MTESLPCSGDESHAAQELRLFSHVENLTQSLAGFAMPGSS